MNDSFPKAGGEQQPITEDSGHSEKIERLLDFFIFNKNSIIAAAVAFVTVAGVLIFLQQQRQSSDKKASLLVDAAVSVMERGDFSRALNGDNELKGLREISETYRSTPSGKFAGIMAGECYFALGEVDAALQAYRSRTDGNGDLSAAARAGEGASLLRKQEFPGASEAFRKAAETALNPALKAFYLTEAAEALIAAGEEEQAAELCVNVIREYPGYASTAKSRTLLLSLAPITGTVTF